MIQYTFCTSKDTSLKPRDIVVFLHAKLEDYEVHKKNLFRVIWAASLNIKKMRWADNSMHIILLGPCTLSTQIINTFHVNLSISYP